MKIRLSLVTASILACYAFSANASGGSTVSNPFLRGGLRTAVPQSPAPAATANAPAESESSWAPELSQPSTISAKDLVEPAPEKGPSYRPKRLIKASAAAQAKLPSPDKPTSKPSQAEAAVTAASASSPGPALAPPLPSPPLPMVLPPPLPKAAAVAPVTHPLGLEGDAQASSTDAPKAVPSADEKIAEARAARKARCADVEFKGKQLTVIPPTSTTFMLPFNGLKGCLVAIGAQEPWVEVVDSRSDSVELFADENTTGANRRASINVVTPSGTIEVRVLQRKYDLPEKKSDKPATPNVARVAK